MTYPCKSQRFCICALISEPREPERVDRKLGCAEDCQIGQDLSGDRAETESMSTESRCDDQAFHIRRSLDDWQRVGCQIE